ncbi:MAG TPA: hemolysin family protein [Stellaceae bacterium]|jgi:CBS domain containing-hemolysin-like protein|nr:hemolysin family protein [Stellaceae bacterium]
MSETSQDGEGRSLGFWERLRRWTGRSEDSGFDAEDWADDADLDPHERIVIENVLRLRDRTAWDVMVPRVDIVAVEVGTSFDRLVEIMIEEGHSRLPVYQDGLDHIQGMIHVKDVLSYVATGTKTTVPRLLRKVLFAAPSSPILDLLTQMRAQRAHMAFVVDEFGGIDGLITIEDLVEEIVGDIEDEYDDAVTQNAIERPDGSLIVDARTRIGDLEERLHLSLLDPEAAEEVGTIGGLCSMLAGRIPKRGESFEHPAGIVLEVLEADQRRIRRLRIRKKAENEAAENEAAANSSGDHAENTQD